MRKFKCIRSWARDREGDIIEDYMFRRYPKDIRDSHFKEVVNEKSKKNPVVRAIKKTKIKKTSFSNTENTNVLGKKESDD